MSGSKRAKQEISAGIEVRHSRSCPSGQGGQCTCTPSFRAVAWSHRDQRLVRKTFKTEAAARLWREDARVDLRRGVLFAPRPTKLREIGDAWLSAALGGGIRNRSGDRYKPWTLRGYEQALREYVYPELGSVKLQATRTRVRSCSAARTARRSARRPSHNAPSVPGEHVGSSP
jgi:hypothetical protein